MERVDLLVRLHLRHISFSKTPCQKIEVTKWVWPDGWLNSPIEVIGLTLVSVRLCYGLFYLWTPLIKKSFEAVSLFLRLRGSSSIFNYSIVIPYFIATF